MSPDADRPLSKAAGQVILTIPTTTDTDQDGLNDITEETLVRRYLPYWDYDGQEFVRPISIEQWAGLGYRTTNGFGTFPYNDVPTLLNAVNAFPSPQHWMVTTTGVVQGLPFCNVNSEVKPGCNNAPTYVDAQPMPTSFCLANGAGEVKCNLVWLHYWLFFPGDYKPGYFPFQFEHIGDWEHVCVMAERSAGTTTKPVQLHWHHHGGADVGKSAWRYHSDSWGVYHPRAYVEADAHGIYQYPEGSFADGGGSSDNPLNNPIVFMTGHYIEKYALYPQIDDIIRKFQGRWGQTNGFAPWNISPHGPLFFNNKCDHDYRSSPSASDWATSC